MQHDTTYVILLLLLLFFLNCFLILNFSTIELEFFLFLNKTSKSSLSFFLYINNNVICLFNIFLYHIIYSIFSKLILFLNFLLVKFVTSMDYFESRAYNSYYRS